MWDVYSLKFENSAIYEKFIIYKTYKMATLRTVVTMKILKTSLIMQPNFAIKRWFFKFLISNSMI